MNDQAVDKALLLRLKLGDEAAFKQIFTRWRDPLLHFINNIIGSQDDAEDICQEAFATLWINRGTIDPDKRINTFIFLIAKQITWKHIRKSRPTDDIQTLPEADNSLDLSPEEILQTKEMELLIEYAINKLPPRSHEIFKLHFASGLSHEEIAERLNTNTSNVKAQIHLARIKIKNIISTMLLLFSV